MSTTETEVPHVDLGSLELSSIPRSILESRQSSSSTHDDVVTRSTESFNRDALSGEGASEQAISKETTSIVIGAVTGVTLLSTFLSGLLTVAIPTIAADINLADSLLLWPASIYALVCACLLLLSGSLSDALGHRPMYLVGCFLQTIFSLACGLSRTGPQMIAFRGLAGLALAFCLPASVSIITGSLPAGKRRNFAFASMGGGQPLGFALGLTLGGVFTDSIGWRWGFYIASILNAAVFCVAVWGLPRTSTATSNSTLITLKTEIDWIGAVIISTCLALFSYTFAAITSQTSSIRHPLNITFLAVAFALVPAFILWMNRQTRLNRPALIPNALWRSEVFSTICLCVLLLWGGFNGFEQICTLYFQYVQRISSLDTSLRFLPDPIAGLAANIICGLIVHRVSAYYICIVATVINVVPPLLMAVGNPATTYWAIEFPAIMLQSVGADILFTIANLLITSVFPVKTQGLAGGVFNTVSQTGKSVGLALAAVVANSVTASSRYEDKGSPEAFLEGYRAAYWLCFALNAAVMVMTVVGLRKIGKVGIKRD